MNTDRFTWFAEVYRIQPGNNLAGVPDSHQLIFEIWGDLLPAKGSEYLTGQRMQSDQTHTFYCWMTELPISPHDYLMIRDQRYDVLEAKNWMGDDTFQAITLREVIDGVSS